MDRVDTSDSNFPPQPGKVQIPHPLHTNDSQKPLGCLEREVGRGGVEALNSWCITVWASGKD